MKAVLLLLAVPAVHAAECGNATSSLWETARCPVAADTQQFQRACVPVRQTPTHGSTRGVVLLFHGWTGCADAYTDVSAALNSLGYVTLTPLLPGQGRVLGYGCDVAGACVERGTNPSLMPTTKHVYADFVEWANAMVVQEVAAIPTEARDEHFTVSVLGLSGGGTMALYALTLSGSPFTRAVLVNPVLAWYHTLLTLVTTVSNSGNCYFKQVLCH